MNSVGTGKVFEGKSKLEVTKKTYKDRNINFRKYVKGLMLGMLAHNDYKTLNLEAKTYNITLRLAIYPERKEEKLIYIPAEEQRKIEAAKKKIEEAKKLIKVVK